MDDLVIVHDYLTQRGGAERVVLEMAAAFPDAPVVTSVYEPDGTFPEFEDLDVRPIWRNAPAAVRRDHRLGFPTFAPMFSATRVEAETVLCSSSGWAHGVRGTGRKLVYCYTPARWIYEQEAAFGDQRPALRVAARLARPGLRAWDRRAARSADQYATTSSAMQDRIWRCYSRSATVLPASSSLDAAGDLRPVAGERPGFLLSVARLQTQKNLDLLLRAVATRPDRRLLLIGRGPDEDHLRALAPPNARFLGAVDDAELRWLYSNAAAVVSACDEDYGLIPIEAAAFSTPSVVPRRGGFLDTVRDGVTGFLYDELAVGPVVAALDRLATHSWDEDAFADQNAAFSSAAFRRRLRSWVDDPPAPATA